MSNNEKGFTLVEVLITLSLLGILSTMTFITPTRLYERAKLTSAALEVKAALQFAQQLSLDESREYSVELIGRNYRVREYIIGGRVMLLKEFDKNISVYPGSEIKIWFTRNGESSYGKFILTNTKGDKINIETIIGTGRARVSSIY